MRQQGRFPTAAPGRPRFQHVVLHDQRAAVLHIVEQALIIGAQIGADVVGADPGDNGVVAGRDRRASRSSAKAWSRRTDLAQRVGHLVAGAHQYSRRFSPGCVISARTSRASEAGNSVCDGDVRIVDHLVPDRDLRDRPTFADGARADAIAGGGVTVKVSMVCSPAAPRSKCAMGVPPSSPLALPGARRPNALAMLACTSAFTRGGLIREKQEPVQPGWTPTGGTTATGRTSRRTRDPRNDMTPPDA